MAGQAQLRKMFLQACVYLKYYIAHQEPHVRAHVDATFNQRRNYVMWPVGWQGILIVSERSVCHVGIATHIRDQRDTKTGANGRNLLLSKNICLPMRNMVNMRFSWRLSFYFEHRISPHAHKWRSSVLLVPKLGRIHCNILIFQDEDRYILIFNSRARTLK